MSIGSRKNFIGSSRYGVAISLKGDEFNDAMSGEIHFYDGKHVVDTKRFLTFDQLASSIINYWERSLQTELNTRRFANWLTEYFEDLGVKNANFYDILKAIKAVGKGVSLKSTGMPIKEVKVIPDEFAPVKEEAEAPRKVQLKPVGTFVDHRQLEEPPIPKEKKETQRGHLIEEKKVLPIPSKKIEAPPDEELVKPSQLFGKKRTVSPTVRVLPRVKKEEEKEEPPVDKLLKPSEVLKKRETIFQTKESIGLKEEPYVLPAPEPKQEEKLLRPSEILRERETLPGVKKELEKPKQPVQTKVVSQPTRVRKLQAPEDRLVRPSELFKKPKEKVEKVEHLVRPTEVLKRKTRKEVEEIKISKNEVKKFQISMEAPKKEIPKVTTLPKQPPKKEPVEKAKILEKPKTKSLTPPVETEKKAVATKPRRKLAEEEMKTIPVPKKVSPAPEEKIKAINIETIKGVGATTAQLLKNAGYDSVQKIANSTPEQLSKIKGIGLSTARKIIDNAKKLL